MTGATGQDGSYLVENLLARSYEVHCVVRPERLVRRHLLPDYVRVALQDQKVHLHGIDLADLDAVHAVCREVEPLEVYHLGGPSRVDSNIGGNSKAFRVIVGSTKALLEALRGRPEARFFLAGTSEMFGSPEETPQTEASARNPRSLYGFAKLTAADTVAHHRRRFGAFACTGILFNHESPRREPYFLSRKVTQGLARVALGLQSTISLGNLDAVRDWGYAPDYIEAMQRILASAEPDDYIIATGQTHSVRALAEIACHALNLDPEACVRQDYRFYRPLEPVALCGDPKRIAQKVHWRATKPFEEMIREMVAHDLNTERVHVGRRL